MGAPASRRREGAGACGMGPAPRQSRSICVIKTIKFSNIDISPYPNSFGKLMFKVFMDEEYLSPTITFYGKKELFLEIINNQVKILSED